MRIIHFRVQLRLHDFILRKLSSPVKGYASDRYAGFPQQPYDNIPDEFRFFLLYTSCRQETAPSVDHCHKDEFAFSAYDRIAFPVPYLTTRICLRRSLFYGFLKAFSRLFRGLSQRFVFDPQIIPQCVL